MIDIYANDSLARGLRLRLLWQYLYSSNCRERERGGTERAKPLCVPLPILNIYAYKAGILSYNIARSIEFRFKLQAWARQLNLLVRILLRTSFPLFYVNRHTSPPHTYIIYNFRQWESQLALYVASDINANWKHEMRYIAVHTSHLAYTYFTYATYALPLSLSPLPPNTISARSETELDLSISCRFHAEKITKVFAAILHTHSHTHARIEEFSCVFPPTYYCLNIYTTNSSGRERGDKWGAMRQQRYRVALCSLGNICATSLPRGRETGAWSCWATKS